MADQVVVPSLQRQALLVLCRTWHPARSLTALPVELSRLVWDQLKASHAQEQQQAATAAGGTADAAQVPMPCSVMFPLVRDVWRVRELDLSDAGRWLTDQSLGALAYARGLESVRLTMCRFLTDAGIGQLARCGSLTTVDLSWTELGDAAMPHLASCRGLTSLNLTGLPALTDRGVSALLKLTGMRRLALAATGITDAALDYLTYYTRFPEANTAGAYGVAGLQWLELSNTRITDVGVGKLVAVLEDGKPFGKVFKELEYLALSMTTGVGPSAVRQVRVKYGFDAPLPNAQRTLAKSNAVALQAADWVIRFRPTKERQLPAPARSWEQTRMVAYVAAYTREMAGAAALAPPPAGATGGAKRQRAG